MTTKDGALPGSIGVVRKRSDFLAANSGRRAPMPGFVLLVHDRGDGDPARRFGITVTKKIGNAVVRNRMKRRLRALARDALPRLGREGADHILIGRAGGVEREFSLLTAELDKALRRIANPDALLRKQEPRTTGVTQDNPGLLPSQEHKAK